MLSKKLKYYSSLALQFFIFLVICSQYFACSSSITSPSDTQLTPSTTITTSDPNTASATPLFPNGIAATTILNGSYLITCNALNPCDASQLKVQYVVSGKNISANTQIKWFFGDGVSLIDKPSIVYQYAKSGTFTVKAQILDSNKIAVDSSSAVFTFASPNPNFSAIRLNQTNNNYNYLLTSTSTGNINKYQWSFSNGSIINSQVPSLVHSFPITSSFNDYNVRLTATNSNGCANSFTQNVTIISSGGSVGFDTIAVSQSDPCSVSSNLSEVFTFSSHAPNLPNGLSYTWDFGDNISQNGAIVIHSYQTPGKYSVKLTTTLAGLAYFTATKQIESLGKGVVPLVAFDTTRLAPNTILFTNKCVIVQGTIKNFIWDFGDQKITNLIANSNIAHTYPSINSDTTYTISLNAISSKGCSGIASKTLFILKK